jgi:curved DNA-binding protein CbpA
MKKSVTFKDIEKARKTLGLQDTASMEDIKSSHRNLILKFHPDRHSSSKDKDACQEKVKEINTAYEIIMNYCIRYPISFTRDRVKYIEEGEYQKEHFDRFYSGWVSKE